MCGGGVGGEVMPSQTSEAGLEGQGAILQPAFLTQLIGTIVAEVTPLARSAAIQQGGLSSGQSSAVVSEASGVTEAVSCTPCLPWGSACSGPKGGGSVGFNRDPPWLSADVAMYLDKHLSQATRVKIL